MASKTERILQQTCIELAAASRILAHHGVVDAFGHISVRDPTNPSQFLLSRNLAPALVTQHDILTYRVADAEPVGSLPPKGFVERHIHAQIYRKYTEEEVQAVVHCHAPELLPYGILPQGKLPFLPVYHMAAFLGTETPPIYDNASYFGPSTDLLIRSEQQGSLLASFFEQPSGSDDSTPHIRPLVLMRGHGATITAPSLRLAVYRAIYAVINARVLSQTRALLSSPNDAAMIQYLSAGECAAAHATQVDRAWGVWLKEVGPIQ